MEQKYQAGNEYGTILWDVALILQHCMDYPVVTLPTESLARKYPFRGDKNYAKMTDTSIPGILVQLKEGTDLLIDGNHRLYKCVLDKLPLFQCYYLRKDEHIQFIVNYDAQIYDNVVSHWR